MRRTLSSGRAAGDEYLELIQTLPLCPIRNQDEYDAAASTPRCLQIFAGCANSAGEKRGDMTADNADGRG